MFVRGCQDYCCSLMYCCYLQEFISTWLQYVMLPYYNQINNQDYHWNVSPLSLSYHYTNYKNIPWWHLCKFSLYFIYVTEEKSVISTSYIYADLWALFYLMKWIIDIWNKWNDWKQKLIQVFQYDGLKLPVMSFSKLHHPNRKFEMFFFYLKTLFLK